MKLMGSRTSTGLGETTWASGTRGLASRAVAVVVGTEGTVVRAERALSSSIISERSGTWVGRKFS